MMEEDDREAWEAEIETDVVLQTRIAGHAGIIAKRQYLFKPVQPPYRNEEKVYTKFQDKFPDVLPFIPKFYGVKTRGENSFLVLENLLDKCKKPAFMDLKVGKSLHYREDPLREGVYNLLGLFIHGVSSSFLKLKNRVNEYRGRQVTIDDFDAIIRLFFRMMGPSQEMVDRIKKMIKIIKSMDGVRFYGTSLFIAFDEDESSDFQPSLHMIDFERAKVDAESDGSACLSQEEVAKIFKISKNVQRVVGETDKIQGSGGGPSSVPPRNDTDQQSVDTSLLQETGPDLYILRSLKHLLTIVQEEWSQEEHVRFNPGYNPHVIWRQSRSQDNGILHPQKPLPRRPILVYMVRHGERYDYTDVSWAKQAAYPHDSHLSPIGETQAQDLADRLANARPAMIVASPFQRAILSAIPLARRLRIPVCVEPGLAEFLCKDTRTKIPGFFSSEVSISPWVDINYKPFWPKLKLESWPEMRQRVAVTASHLIKQCQEMGGDLIICSHRSTLTAVFEWLDVSKHPNARLEYGAVAVLARKEWELLDEDVKPDSNSEKYKILDGDSEEVKVEKNGLSECSGWTAISFNEVQHLRNHIQSPSSNPFRHIEGYYEDLSWTNYKKTPVAPLTAPPQSLSHLTDPTSAPPSSLNSSNPDAAPKAN